MASANRYRVMHKFWLDLKKDNEDWLDEQINHLKKSRKFTVILRDALRLILDLRAGRTGVLFELFPWVKESTSVNLEKNDQGELKAELRHLQQLILERGDLAVPASKHPAMKSGIGGRGIMPPPINDEDTLEIKVITGNSGQNLLSKSFELFS